MTTHTPLRAANSVMSAYPGSSGKQVVLLDSGNYPGFSNYLNETWTFNGSTPDWTNQSSSLVNSNGPLPGRINATMSYDGTNVMLYGGQGAESSVGMLNDTWVWNGTTWTQLTGPGFALAAPFSRTGAKSAALSALGSGNAGVVMFGGQNLLYNLLETWTWDGTTQTWAQIAVSNGTGPAARTGHVMASNGTKIVMFGGQGTNQQFNDTWTYTTVAGWTQIIPTTPPSVRSGACMAYDSTNSKWIMFGGENEYNYLLETWVLNAGATAWTQVSVPAGTGPAGRVGAQMAFDAASAKTIMFGGYSAVDNYASDGTWSFDGSALTWTKL